MRRSPPQKSAGLLYRLLAHKRSEEPRCGTRNGPRERKMKKISTHQHVKLLRNGPTVGVFNSNRPRLPKPIATIEAYSKEDQQKKKTLKKRTKGRVYGVCLVALAARRERSSPAPAQPSPRAAAAVSPGDINQLPQKHTNKQFK